jgi:hypothetical protein
MGIGWCCGFSTVRPTFGQTVISGATLAVYVIHLPFKTEVHSFNAKYVKLHIRYLYPSVTFVSSRRSINIVWTAKSGDEAADQRYALRG